MTDDNTPAKTDVNTVVIDIRLDNRPPTADADGPYTVVEGGSVRLDASASADPDQGAATLIYEWDFDYDGTFDADVVGVMPVFDASDLDGPSARTIAARVTDDGGLSDVATATIQINNVVPTLADATFAIPENSPVGTVIGTVTGTDPATTR